MYISVDGLIVARDRFLSRSDRPSGRVVVVAESISFSEMEVCDCSSSMEGLERSDTA